MSNSILINLKISVHVIGTCSELIHYFTTQPVVSSQILQHEKLYYHKCYNLTSCSILNRTTKPVVTHKSYNLNFVPSQIFLLFRGDTLIVMQRKSVRVRARVNRVHFGQSTHPTRRHSRVLFFLELLFPKLVICCYIGT